MNSFSFQMPELLWKWAIWELWRTATHFKVCVHAPTLCFCGVVF